MIPVGGELREHGVKIHKVDASFCEECAYCELDGSESPCNSCVDNDKYVDVIKLDKEIFAEINKL